MTPTIKKVIWAVDALNPSKASTQAALKTLKNLNLDQDAVIEPVYILSPDQLSLSVEFTPPWVKQYKPAAEKALQQVLKTAKNIQIQKPHIIVQSLPSLSRSVEALVSHAITRSADLIVTQTSSKKGIARFFLGSFAETLLLKSKVPVLLINPHTKTIQPFKHILFPSDFTTASREVFEKTVQLAAQFKAKITLYHKLPNPIEPVFQSGVYLLGGHWVPVHTYFNSEFKSRKATGEGWVAWAKSQGVNVELMIDEKAGSTADSVSALAKKKKVGLICMASESGAVGSALLGSVTRQVVRSASCPVWVLHADSSSYSTQHPHTPVSQSVLI